MSSPISGFTAIPNPYMVPLLFLQSLLIGAGFGIGYQGERRKLSAMSNDEFNKTDLGLYAFDQFKGILARNDFGKMLDLMHPLTEKLATSFGELVNNFPEIFGGFVAGATGQTQKTSSPSGPSFTGGLPAVDSGIGDFFTAIAELIRSGTNFTKGGNPSADFQAIIKEEKEKNKANAPTSPDTLKLMQQVQSKNIQTFQDKLSGESDRKKQVRADVEKSAQLLVDAELQVKSFDTKKKQTHKSQYRIRLTAYHTFLQKYNRAVAVFQLEFPNMRNAWKKRSPAKF